MSTEGIVSIVFTIIGTAATIWGLFQNRDKRRLERAVEIQLATLAGDITYILESADWAYQHFQKIRDKAHALPEGNDKNEVFSSLQLGSGDSVSVKRLLVILLSTVQALQLSMFGDTPIRLPDIKKN